jgi:hypothetical protein
MKANIILAALLSVALSFGTAEARGHSYGHTSYGGGHHTYSHGGTYRGGYGSSHRGGHYTNYRTGNHYGRHR